MTEIRAWCLAAGAATSFVFGLVLITGYMVDRDRDRDPDPWTLTAGEVATADAQRTPPARWLTLWMMSTAISALAAIISYRVNTKVLTVCADGNASGFAYGADHIGHWAYAFVIAGAVPAIAAAAYLSRHLNLWAALLIATVCGVGMLWLGLDSLPSTLCPDGFPPAWPTWLA